MKITVLADADAVACFGCRPHRRGGSGQLWRHAAVSSWPSAAATPRGKCCVPWQEKKFPGRAYISCRWTNAWPQWEMPDRNFTHLRESLSERAPLRPEQIHDMPVEAPDLGLAATQYALMLREIVGVPPVWDSG